MLRTRTGEHAGAHGGILVPTQGSPPGPCGRVARGGKEDAAAGRPRCEARDPAACGRSPCPPPAESVSGRCQARGSRAALGGERRVPGPSRGRAGGFSEGEVDATSSRQAYSWTKKRAMAPGPDVGPDDAADLTFEAQIYSGPVAFSISRRLSRRSAHSACADGHIDWLARDRALQEVVSHGLERLAVSAHLLVGSTFPSTIGEDGLDVEQPAHQVAGPADASTLVDVVQRVEQEEQARRSCDSART